MADSDDTFDEDESARGAYYPAIFIACGGAGAKIVQRIRRLLIERQGGFDARDVPGVAFISVDSDISSASPNHQGQDFGAMSDQLPFAEDERVELDGAGVAEWTRDSEALRRNAHIGDWFPEELLPVARGINLSMGCGQMRPLGRLLALAHHAAIAECFLRAYRRVTTPVRGGSRCILHDRVNVVICGSLAGGTGSGIAIDVAAIVRDAKEHVVVRGVFVLPTAFASVVRASHLPNLYANGYASLAELAHTTVADLRIRYDAASLRVVRPNNPAFDRIELYDTETSGGFVARTPDAVYAAAAAACVTEFLDMQSEFAFVRASIEVNRAMLGLGVVLDQVSVTGGDEAPIAVDLVQHAHRRRFGAAGVTRASTPGWRVLNGFASWLALTLVSRLESIAADDASRETVSRSVRVLERYTRDYALERPDEGVEILPPEDADEALEHARTRMLGGTSAERQAAVDVLAERVRVSLAVPTDDTLLARLIENPSAVMADVRRACWRALRGANGTTDAFGEARPALLEHYRVEDALRVRFGTPDNPELAMFAAALVARALPWAKPRVAPLPGLLLDMYVLVPRPSGDFGVALRRAVREALGEYPSLNVLAVSSDDTSEVVLQAVSYGMVPADLDCMSGDRGMYACFQASEDARARGEPAGFVHVLGHVAAMPRVGPLPEDEGRAIVAAWSSLLCGLLTGDVRTRVPLATDGASGDPEQPVIVVPGRGDGPDVELGTVPAAVARLARSPEMCARIDANVTRRVHALDATGLAHLVALARYTRLFVHPAERGNADTGYPARTLHSPGWAALHLFEARLADRWVMLEQPENIAAARGYLVGPRVGELLLEVGTFGSPTNLGPYDVAVTSVRGVTDPVEIVPAPPFNALPPELRREAVLHSARGALPPAFARTESGASADAGGAPWLRLGDDR